MSQFIPGLELNEQFFRDVVEPLIAAHAPALPYAAGRIGAGSDVLGFDTERSMDHDWGPRLTIWLADEDLDAWQKSLDAFFGELLPATFRGFPTRYAGHESDGTFHMEDAANGRALRHLIEITTVARWFGGVGAAGIDTSEWIKLPNEWLASVSTPRPFHARPFTVLASARFSEALVATIRDPLVRALPRNLGGIDQYMDSTDALGNGALHRAIREWIGRS